MGPAGDTEGSVTDPEAEGKRDDSQSPGRRRGRGSGLRRDGGGGGLSGHGRHARVVGTPTRDLPPVGGGAYPPSVMDTQVLVGVSGSLLPKRDGE